jgi:signal transduction histidine kinase
MGEFLEPGAVRAARLAALADLDILDTPPEPEFDDLVLLASALCEAPIALVTLVTDERQWFKARRGALMDQTPLEQSVCKYTMSVPDVLVLPDLREDPRTTDNTLVTQAPSIRFYAGAPLRTRAGVPLGAVCVIDTAPRPEGLTEAQTAGLKALARHTATLLEARRRSPQQDTGSDAKLAAVAEALDSERRMAELRERFVAVLGHDLRNPLTAIDAGLRLLARDPTSDTAQALLPLMKQSVVRMRELVETTLDFARIRLGGGIDLHRRTRDPLLPVLEHVVAEARASHPECRILSDLDLTAPVHCDPDRLGQMLSNLLGNAVTHGDRSQPIRVAATTRDGEFTMAVANSGAPIPPDLQARLFEPFARGARPEQKGLGLGLYIAAEIARAHHGSLGVTSTPEQTRFVFRMPLTAH